MTTFRMFHSGGIALVDELGFPIELLSLPAAIAVYTAFKALNPSWIQWKIVDSHGNTWYK